MGETILHWVRSRCKHDRAKEKIIIKYKRMISRKVFARKYFTQHCCKFHLILIQIKTAYLIAMFSIQFISDLLVINWSKLVNAADNFEYIFNYLKMQWNAKNYRITLLIITISSIFFRLKRKINAEEKRKNL